MTDVTRPNAFREDLIPTTGGEPYRIFVYRPAGSPPADGWPLLCLTDGNAAFATAVDAMLVQASYPQGTHVTEGVVAAIGYPTDKPYDPLRRSWDLSPPPGATYPPFSPEGPPVRTGGGEAFLRFIADDLLPWLSDQAPIDPRLRSLFGHSFGGLFALMALFTRPALFQTYISASPALYWENSALRPAEDAFFAARDEGLPLRVLLSAGAYEGDTLAPFYKGRADEAERLAHQRAIRTVGFARDLTDRINATGRPSLTASFEEFPGENHMSVLPVAINRAIQAAFAIS